MISRNFAELFAKVGLDAKKVKTVLKNAELSNKLFDIFEARKIETPQPDASNLVYFIVSSKSDPFQNHQTFLLDNIFEGNIESKQQLKIAEEYLKDKETVENLEEFNTTCGVGIKITDDDIKEYLTTFITEHKDFIISKGGKLNNPDVLFKCKEGMPFADPGKFMKLSGPIIKDIIGVIAKPKKVKKKKAKKQEAEKFSKIDITKLVAREVAGDGNSEEVLAKHKKATGGKVVTRFPPEPNGILHIGHARAIRFNFSISGVYEGDCILRFDDTNPEKESLEFIENIKQNVNWFGYEPSKVTFSSNYFGRIYQ